MSNRKQSGNATLTTDKAKKRRADQQAEADAWLTAEKDTYDIFLHLPDKLRDDVKVEYAEAKGGAMAQFMARLFAFGADDDAVQKMQGKRNFDMDEIMTELEHERDERDQVKPRKVKERSNRDVIEQSNSE